MKTTDDPRIRRGQADDRCARPLRDMGVGVQGCKADARGKPGAGGGRVRREKARGCGRPTGRGGECGGGLVRRPSG